MPWSRNSTTIGASFSFARGDRLGLLRYWIIESLPLSADRMSA